MRKEVRASITLLVVCIFPALLFCTCVSIDVSQYYSNKTICESAMDVGINSALADHPYFICKDYGLLCMDENIVYYDFCDSFYASTQISEDDKDTNILVVPQDYLSDSTVAFDLMCQTGAYKTLLNTGGTSFVDEKLMMEYQHLNSIDLYYPSLNFDKKFFVVGRLLGEISSKIEEHNLSTNKETRKKLATEIANLMIKVESIDPDFRSRLVEGDVVNDGWFIVNIFYDEISIKTWESLWDNLSSYSCQTLPKLFVFSVNEESLFNPNATQVDTLLKNYYVFDSKKINFNFDDYKDYLGMDEYDFFAFDLFTDVDTWTEDWQTRDIDDLYTDNSYLQKVDEIMHDYYMQNGTVNTAFCNYITSYFSHYGDNQKTKSIMPNAEIEYILGGQRDIGKNYQIVFNRIFAMRFLENYEVISNMAYKQVFDHNNFQDYRYCEYYISLEADLRWALVESYIETYLVMVRQQPIATYKNEDNMITTRDNLAAGINLDKVTAKIDGEYLDYEECLKLLLMDESSYYATGRAKTVIRENEFYRYGMDYNYDNLFVTVKANVSSVAKAKFTSALKLPGTDTDTSSILHFENINIEETASYIY